MMMSPGKHKDGAQLPIEGDLPLSPAGEHYGQMVSRILARDLSQRQILVTSAEADEGKTVTAINLALAFHVRRIPVLLAELSLVTPKLEAVFGASPLEEGIEAVLKNGSPLQSTICVRNDNQFSVAMVKHAQGTLDLLRPGQRLEKLLADARREYEWTVFDGPSVEATENIHTLASSFGLVILVARARQTRPEALKKALAEIDHPSTMVLLNDT